MTHDWSDLFITDSGEGSEDSSEDQALQQRRGFFGRLRDSLTKTRRALGTELSATLFENIDEQTWERLEEALIMADVGAANTAAVIGELEREAIENNLDPQQLSERLIKLLAESAQAPDRQIDIRQRPTVIMLVGVNGTGKTTTAGKLAWRLHHDFKRSVLLAAADTYRAAATEQLEGWAQRAEVPIITGRADSDPGAVAFEAIAQANRTDVDIVIIDTAGRLHTHENLMAELEKVQRVIARQMPGAPHQTLLTLDATTGQNGLRQAKLFMEAVDVHGIVLTKLDGSAKGGIALAITRETGLPVKLIGLGERLEDLRPFDAEQFARALIAGG